MKLFYFYVFFVTGISMAFSAPTVGKSYMVCAQYVAPGMVSTSTDQLSSDDYVYEDDGSDEENQEYKDNSINEKYIKSGDEIHCPNRNDVCYSVWKVGQNGTIVIVRQGCWQSDDKHETCSKNHCTSEKTKNYRFCCCSGNLCNANITSIEIPDTSIKLEMNSTIQSISSVASFVQSPLTWISMTLLTIILIVIVILLTRKQSTKPMSELAPLAPAGPGYSSNLHNVDNLSLCSLIGQGKFGTVWKGMINEHPVAVKIFPAQHKQYFLNEKNIYSLDFINHPNVLEYYGSDTRRTFNDNIEYLLVLALAPLGCLQDWLMDNTCSFHTFSKMATSITRGLAHLHSPIKKDDIEKPCVCHRDLNTRNILVKSDLSCCISDFGFALKTYGPRYEWKGEINLAETKSINEVGTLRYMAPEVLEGAVNLRDCETALKQIDVYSLGLVLWELSVRCHDWYQNGEIPPAYRAPYETEAGKNATFEQMQIIVSRHKIRPGFSQNWGGDLASKIARETCEDCWDHDAEARLTALCVEERICEMTNSRSRSPNPELILPNNLQSTVSVKNVHNPMATPNFSHNSYQNNDATIITPPNQIIPNASNDTVDTILSDPAPIHLRNNRTSASSTPPHSRFQNQIQTPCPDDQLLKKILKTDRNNSERSDESSTQSAATENSVNNKLKNLRCGRASSRQMIAERKFKGWHKVRTMIQKKLLKRCPYKMTNKAEERSNLVDSHLVVTVNVSPVRKRNTTQASKPEPMEPQTKLSPRPSNLDLSRQTNIFSLNDQRIYKRAPGHSFNETFAIINQGPQIIVSHSGRTAIGSDIFTGDEKQLKRQRSLEMFNQVFGTKGSIERLRNPSERVKTPGDVPPSVRKVRASKTLSLYDDRMMDTTSRNTL